MAKMRITQTVVDKAETRTSRYQIRDTDMPGFALIVEASGTKTYYVDYYDSTKKRRYFKIGRSETMSAKQAREAARSILSQVNLGQDPIDRPQKKELTLGAFIDDHYAPWVMENRKGAAATIAMIKHDFGFLWSKPLLEISLIDIEKWQSEKRKTNKAASINRVSVALKAALNWGVKRDIISVNPIERLEKLKEVDSPGRVRYLTDDERERLYKVLDLHDKKHRDHIRPMIILSLNTGIRRGALFGLQWGDIDIANRKLRLRAEEAKSGKLSYVPLNDEAREVLTDWRDRQMSIGNDDLVFISKRTGRRFDNCNSAWETLMIDAAIEDFHWHDMRHDFASRLVMAGIDLNTVRELLCHADIKMTLRYAHLAPQKMDDAVKVLAVSNPS